MSGPPTVIAPTLQYTPGPYTPMSPCVISVERSIAPGANEKVHGCAGADNAVRAAP